MFWQSVILGLQAFGDWHILVGIFGMMALTYFWRLIAVLVTGGAGSGVRAAVGCVMSSLGEIVVQAIAVSLFVLFCLPSIVLREGFTSAGVVSASMMPVLKTGLVSLGLVFLISFLPVGRLVTGTGVSTFLIGVFVFRSVIESSYEYKHSQLSDQAFPNFWLSLAYIGIGVVIAYVGTIGLSFAGASVEKRMSRGYESPDAPFRWGFLVGALFGSVIGIIPLLMYGKYVALFLRSHW